jgi:hypothetical protein
MGLGIIFCMTEVQILQDVQAQILDGKDTDPRVATLLGFFPASYCAFEVIVLLRTFFFLWFNIINAYSICYIVDDTKAKVFKADQIYKNQMKTTELL